MTKFSSYLMTANRFKLSLRVLVLMSMFVTSTFSSRVALAETASSPRTDIAVDTEKGRSTVMPSDKVGAHGEDGEHMAGTFDAHAGTWVNAIARAVMPGWTGGESPQIDQKEYKKTGEKHFKNPNSIKYDFIVVGFLIMGALALTGTIAARKVRIRPEGKGHSLPNLFEAALEGFQNYIVGVMGRDLARKYTPLIASFFFCILFFNWMGLVPGMIAPTANPNTTIALAIVAFIATHFIAMREVGFKAWAMHFVGVPVWLCWLNIPLHIMGELVKPVALAIRLLCNVFGEEMVIYKLATMAVAAMATLYLPIPFQFPIMVLGVLFGFLQALVFSTLLAIYISSMSTHHDDHDAHNDHGHVEHVKVGDHREVIAHPTQATLA